MNQEIHLTMGHGEHTGHSSDISPGELVPIVIPIASLGASLAVVAIILYFRFRSQRLKHELVRMYLEKGHEVPPLVLGDDASKQKNADLRRGLVLLATGVSLAIAFAVQRDWGSIGFGAIPSLIGLAYLAVWRFERSQSGAEHG